MTRLMLPLALATSLALAAPVQAQTCLLYTSRCV